MTGCARCGGSALIEVERDVYARCPCTADPDLTVTGTRDPAAGVAARDRAVESVGNNTRADWIARARRAVRDLCAAGRPFTTDDVWAIVRQAPPEPRAMGAVMTWARAKHLCVPTDRVVPSDRPESHRRPVRVWEPRKR